MLHNDAINKMKSLSDELDKNGFTSILILRHKGHLNGNTMYVTYPEDKPSRVKKLIDEAALQIEADPPTLPVHQGKEDG